MKIFIGADHGGFRLKEDLIPWLRKEGHMVKDLGTYSQEPCDYPVITYTVAKYVSGSKNNRGVVICKSGIGNSIVANKLPGIRAALCLNVKMARLSRRHNDANILVLGATLTNFSLAKKILQAWLNTAFEGGRHLRRIKQISAIEKEIIKKFSK